MIKKLLKEKYIFPGTYGMMKIVLVKVVVYGKL